MLYVVECAHIGPQSETVWDTSYSQEKLPTLVSVPGFCVSQRFRALSEECPRYLVLHDIHGATVIDSDAYRHNGGDHFARWQSTIIDWHCHLCVADSGVREVRSDEVFLLSDMPQTLPISPAIILLPDDLVTQQTRYVAIVPRDGLHHLATAAIVFIYQPTAARSRNPAQRAWGCHDTSSLLYIDRGRPDGDRRQ